MNRHLLHSFLHHLCTFKTRIHFIGIALSFSIQVCDPDSMLSVSGEEDECFESDKDDSEEESDSDEDDEARILTILAVEKYEHGRRTRYLHALGRTLYVRFGRKAGPHKFSEIFKLDKTIKVISISRHAFKFKDLKKEQCIRHCFIEFSDEGACESAKDKLRSAHGLSYQYSPK